MGERTNCKLVYFCDLFHENSPIKKEAARYNINVDQCDSDAIRDNGAKTFLLVVFNVFIIIACRAYFGE